MARPIWKGSISFGLVNIPVGLYSAEQSYDLHFNLLDKRDKAHIRYKRVNEMTGKEVPSAEIVKGFEIEKDEYVILADEDFERVKVESTKTVDILDFVDLESIGPQYFDKPYYLVPDAAGRKGYVLLRDTLKKQKKVGVAKVVLRSRENLACVIPYEDTLQLIMMRFREEVREPDDVDFPALGQTKTNERELEVAAQLVKAMTSEWDPDQYEDEYETALHEYVKRKHKEGEEFHPPEPEEKEASKSSDLMELLRQSLSKGGQRGETPRREKKSEPARKKARAKAS